mmetsp:Transcript_97113/g.216618  ORF Transcript_97113/g.216618 Transcript_97113/m.216618 type:complete len:829 (-) Transcript_97113:172-2658(-)
MCSLILPPQLAVPPAMDHRRFTLGATKELSGVLERRFLAVEGASCAVGNNGEAVQFAPTPMRQYRMSGPQPMTTTATAVAAATAPPQVQMPAMGMMTPRYPPQSPRPSLRRSGSTYSMQSSPTIVSRGMLPPESPGRGTLSQRGVVADCVRRFTMRPESVQAQSAGPSLVTQAAQSAGSSLVTQAAQPAGSSLVTQAAYHADAPQLCSTPQLGRVDRLSNSGVSAPCIEPLGSPPQSIPWERRSTDVSAITLRGSRPSDAAVQEAKDKDWELASLRSRVERLTVEKIGLVAERDQLSERLRTEEEQHAASLEQAALELAASQQKCRYLSKEVEIWKSVRQGQEEDHTATVGMLLSELDHAQEARGQPPPAWPSMPPAGDAGLSPAPAVMGSEERLRAALMDRNATAASLGQAVLAVEGLMEEARRELAAKRLRERRAAMEQLHASAAAAENAGAGGDAPLAEALEAARLAGVDEEDVRHFQARLDDLRSLSDEEHAARVARVLAAQHRERAFLFVKRDEADSLRELLQSLDRDGFRNWRDWRDQAGRSLRTRAKDLGAERVQQLLAELLGGSLPSVLARSGSGVLRRIPEEDRAGGRPSDDSEAEKGASKFGAAPPAISAPAMPAPATPAPAIAAPTVTATALAVPGVAFASSPAVAQAQPEVKVDEPEQNQAPEPGRSQEPVLVATTPATSKPPPDREAELKAKAFRAVVQDDVDVLSEVLERTPTEIWSQWVNKAGKDLLALSQERGCSGAYGALARALGLLQDMKQEAFAEHESVWVFVPGEVQPLRATVLEDTTSDADEVEVEFWDGEEPRGRVKRGSLRKSFG